MPTPKDGDADLRDLPPRPSLARDAAARWYVRGSARRLLLFHARSEGVIELGSREWEVLAALDGTRDLEGAAVAVRASGRRVAISELSGFARALASAGLISADPVPRRGGTAVEDAPARPALPVVVLPAFELRCDGSGGCCRFYATTLFSPLEAARARSLQPQVLDGGDDEAHAFTPERGPLASAARAVGVVDGRCAYLDEARRCSLEVAGGSEAKPLGCRLFPTTFVDDGADVRVAVAPECACVFDSLEPGGPGAPLVPSGVRWRADLDRAAAVSELPAEVALTSDVAIPRRDFALWCDALPFRRVDPDPSIDVPAWLWWAAEATARGGLPASADLTVVGREGVPIDDPLYDRYRIALTAAVERRARRDAAFRAPNDLVLLLLGRLLPALPLLGHAGLERRQTAGEWFYARTLAFARSFADGRPLVTCLRDRALRLWLARALGEITAAGDGLIDPAFRQPIALVEALVRGHGLDAYAAAAGGA